LNQLRKQLICPGCENPAGHEFLATHLPLLPTLGLNLCPDLDFFQIAPANVKQLSITGQGSIQIFRLDPTMQAG
jgi:hypothetical protein